MNYYWRGNIRQLKNVAEQISAIETSRTITPEVLSRYLAAAGAGRGLPCPRPWGSAPPGTRLSPPSGAAL